MIQDIQNLLTTYYAWLKDKTELHQLDQWVEITTPYLDRHNDYVQIYVKKTKGGFLLTDDGYTIDDLQQSGCKLDNRKRQAFLKMTLNGFGVKQDGKALQVHASAENFAARKHNLVQAMLAVNDMFYLAVPVVTSLFYEDVVAWFDANDIRHIPKVKFTGTTGYDHLFRENRFSGADRIGDENRLVLAFDTRLRDGGRELFHGRLGQMRHLAARRVRFCTTANPVFREYECPDNGAPHDQPRSTWIATLKAWPHRAFMIGAALEQDNGMAGDARVSLDLRFHPSPDQVFNVGYRRFPETTRSRYEVEEIVDETAEVVHASFYRDLGPHLSVFGSANRALRESLFSSVYFGVEYRSCCWRLRFIGRRYLTDENGPPEQQSEVMLQWELRGLGSSAFRPEQSGVHTIPGYRNHF